MYTAPLTPGIISPIPQATLNTWDAMLPREQSGMAGLGCTDCGGTCGHVKGLAGVMDDLAGLSPVTSLAVHVGLAWVAYHVFKVIFLGQGAKDRNAAISHAKHRRARAVAAGDAAVKKARSKSRWG